ncbi:hybrid sensor histidine kinase/response regulator [Chelatococcus reniformis]|uniref:histidine kinase n=1 Tax=Chelatococcus reniformis TaxID=1494448 RepID=A0A916TZB7_9HYPH|nr:PAS domain-containing sensor histidine kinase [Chelatococcus reniformis]GGC46771.1 hybrid sensor histidine kinase/response regulator [Chelatococcus reniformis]
MSHVERQSVDPWEEPAELRARLAALESNLASSFVFQIHAAADRRSRRFVYVSPACTTITGVSPEAVLANPDLLHSLIDDDDRERLLAAERAAHEAAMPFLFEGRARRADTGEVRRCRIRSTPRIQPDGSYVWDGIHTDTTEQIVAQEQLNQRESELALVQRIGGVAGVDVDLANGFRNRRSPEYLQLHGLPPSASSETHEAWVARVHPDDRAATDRAFREAVAGSAPDYSVEYRIIRPSDGHVRWLAVRAQIERDEAGRPLRLFGAHIDITERKQAEEELRLLNERLEAVVEERTRQLVHSQKMESLGQLTGGVAHDFNNLLMAILGSLELLRKRLPDEPRTLRLLDNAVSAAERGSGLTQRLLAFARQQQLRPTAVDVEELVGGMHDLLEQSLGSNVTLRRGFAPGLAPAHVDPAQLELAILNLAVNARDAMPAGGRLSIHGRAADQGPDRAHPGRFIVIEVTDTGQGMDARTLARAAEPFFTTKGVGKGTGLGLSMIQGLAEQSGGHFRLASTPGVGTTAELWLPLARPGAHEPRAAAAPRGSGGHVRTVLLVDDDPLVLTGTAAMLEDLGYRVIEAQSARSALDILARGEAADVLMTDHAMPGMTGAALADRAKALRPGLPVLLATGYADPGDTGAVAVRLAKPFRREALATALADLLGS